MSRWVTEVRSHMGWRAGGRAGWLVRRTRGLSGARKDERMGANTRWTTRWGGFGARYVAVALGSGLLLYAGDAARLMLVGPISPARGLATAAASALGLLCLLAACLPVEMPPPVRRLYARGWPLAAVGAGLLA